MALNREWFCLLGDIWQCQEAFLVVTTGLWEGVTAIQWVEAKDAAQFLQCTGPSSTTQNHLAPNVTSAKVEKSCCRSREQCLARRKKLLDFSYYYFLNLSKSVTWHSRMSMIGANLSTLLSGFSRVQTTNSSQMVYSVSPDSVVPTLSLALRPSTWTPFLLTMAIPIPPSRSVFLWKPQRDFSHLGTRMALCCNHSDDGYVHFLLRVKSWATSDGVYSVPGTVQSPGPTTLKKIQSWIGRLGLTYIH